LLGCAQILGNLMNKEANINIDKINELFLTSKRGEIYPKAIADTEKILIEKALECSFGNQIAAAKILGLNRNTLRTKIRKLNIEVSKFKL